MTNTQTESFAVDNGLDRLDADCQRFAKRVARYYQKATWFSWEEVERKIIKKYKPVMAKAILFFYGI